MLVATRDVEPLVPLIFLQHGFAMGQWYASKRALFFSIVPPGKEMQYSGLYNFSGLIFSWAPALAAGIIVQVTNSIRYSMVVLLGK